MTTALGAIVVVGDSRACRPGPDTLAAPASDQASRRRAPGDKAPRSAAAIVTSVRAPRRGLASGERSL
jgi:hypothetical protein